MRNSAGIFTCRPFIFLGMVTLLLSLFLPMTALAHEKDEILLVNKENSLSADYVPDNLVYPNVSFSSDRESMQQHSANALEEMFAAASNDGVQLYAASGYRSYDYQADLYQYWVNRYGEERANQISAKPGESEHQTGLVMDVTSASVNYELVQSFGDTTEGQWVENNAANYGFIVRYPEGKQHITGYQYEPWHLRYVGADHAAEIAANNLTLEEYLSQDSSDGTRTYTIQAGDTFWKIANDHGTTVDQLLALNPDFDPLTLQIGDQILLPGDGSTNPDQPNEGTSYTVKAGDTFWGIASNYSDVTVQELMDANPDISPRYLSIGTTLTIPTSSDNQNGEQYVVATGNVWIHSTPDFTVDSRNGVLYNGERVELLGETTNMYQIPDGYVSKNYAEIVE
ncbi:D-alanyl-D-alanine carboxypeptidase family protein [Planococcus halotolerans]|uniref:LysM domain-containing protein n=1 Tax=Planococcus halotolerans TaxID=2233542 RepID=A0A365KXH8_9BACL|nr:D-alanyl-D-alanine carboxypeptidase family protein [Planococcus halotolerans]QHJ72286.1 LysM peptidoglycan-binding domain-containing protein [Planococcus halotolerans]RAZ77693.1 hypothetical protein DP120_09420 [Planococcus halotolerans]